MIFFTYLCTKNEHFMLRIECEDIELSDLILRGRCTTNRFYKKLSSNASFKTDLAKVLKKMKMVNNVSELKDIGSLHYEPLVGDLLGYSSVRIGYKSKYRLLFTEHEEGIVIKLITISEHYGDK